LKRGRSFYSIFDELAERIKKQQQSIEVLALAELGTYKRAGSTTFSQTGSRSVPAAGRIDKDPEYGFTNAAE
jgi:hypothetical protein